MKWNNRLKSALTPTAKSEFSEECLNSQLTKADETTLKLVSSVFVSDEFRQSPEKQTNFRESEKQSNLVSSAFVSCEFRESFKNNDELADFKSEKLHESLNRYIADGITFDVSADDFQTIDRAQRLKASDREFLKLNGAAILCELQQSLLMKHLFKHSPERFEDFAFEITERESLMTITAKTPFEIYIEAVKDVTKKWFAELL